MQLFRRARENCFCAFCKSKRVIYTQRRINVFNMGLATLSAVLIMMLIWQKFDPRVVLIWIVCMVASEIFIQVRWRLNIVCKHCGFDPVLYLRDSEKAANKVKAFLDKRKEDPATLFKAPLQIPVLRRQKQPPPVLTKAAAPGRLVSKKV